MNRLILIATLATCFAAAGQDAAPLGSTTYAPSPEHPVGWRGDGTGRYPAATPPLTWSRRVQGFTSELKYQAAKPAAGAPGPDAKPLEYFTLKDWLIAGPFNAPDPAKDIETDFLKGEAAIEPNTGDKAGDAAWKMIHLGMDNQSNHAHNGGICRNLNLDFVSFFATISRVKDAKDPTNIHTKYEGDLANKCAYAHTYVYSPAAGDAMLTVGYAGAAARAWLNGKPLTFENNKSVKVDLAQGWNRLLLKLSNSTALVSSSGASNMSTWRLFAYITPSKPATYESKNIAWMTRVTGRSMSNPIVVGDRIFFGSGVSDLTCVNKADGKVRWLHASTPWDAMTAEEKAQNKDKLESQISQLEQFDTELVAMINAGVSPQGLSLAQQTELDKKLKAKADFERTLHKTTFWSIDPKRYPPMTGNEVSSSNATPCSDGARVYWASGGGMKGPGASVVCCFDLDGKRLWTYHEAFGAAEHGLHTSPILVDGKLIYAAYKTLIAFDPPTGKILWRTPTPESGGASPQVVKVGNESAVYVAHIGRVVGLYRVSDGVRIAANDMGLFGDSTPITEGGVIYVADKFKRWADNNVAFAALQIPTAPGEKLELKQTFELDSDQVYVPMRGIAYFVASSLYVDGLVYSLDMSGGLSVIDVAAKAGVYHRWLDWYARYDRYLYGAVACPTLAGKNIFLVDDAGSTIIMTPGKEYKEVARNIIENTFPASESGNPCRQEAFYSSPVFEGSSIYLKGEEYLYCIRETK